MTTKELRISNDLRLPADDFIESKGAIIGKSGRGKSGGVKVLVEECVRSNLPFVELDPTGVAWGIRSSFDGSKPSGMKILIIGGRHGDMPLERGAGADVAREVVRANISCIIDFQGIPKSVYRQFTKDFCDTMLEINDSPRLVIIEEAHNLVPQLVRPDQTACFDSVSTFVAQGRNMGIGVVLVSQRTMKINKDVLSQADWVLVFGLAGKHDRKAMKEWVEDKDVDEDLWEKFENGLAKLPRQHAWFWSPEAFGGAFKVVKIRNFTTLHPDRTHLRKLGLLDKKPVTTDIAAVKAKLGTAMARLAEEKTAVVDAKRLQGRIRQLEGELAKEKARPAAAAAPKLEVKRVEVPVLRPAQLQRAEALIRATNAAAEKMDAAATKFALGLSVVAGELSSAVKLGRAIPTAPAVAPLRTPARSGLAFTAPSPRRMETPAIREARASAALDDNTHAQSEGEPSLLAGERRMLQAVAQRHPLKVTRSQIGTFAGFTPSGGTFGNYYGRLRKFGFLQENGNGEVIITQPGLDYLGEDISPTPATTAELLDMWRKRLLKGEVLMLDELVKIYPEGITRLQLGERTGYASSGGTFGNYLGTLRRNELAVVDGDQVKASETLFIDGA